MILATEGNRTIAWTAALLLAVGLAGCDPNATTWGEPGLPSRQKLDTRNVAAGLGMTIEHVSRTSATLRRGCESVVLYSEPAGQVYVNGQAMPDSGGIEAVDGTLLVPAPLVRRICAALGPETPRMTAVSQDPPDFERPSVEPTPRRMLGRVVLDAGHGGKDPGAIAASGLREKDVVLSVTTMAAAELRARGVEVFLTRANDRFIELEDRPVVAEKAGADLFVSIHADAARNKSAKGFTAYVDRTPSRQSIAAANAILRQMCVNCSPSRGVKNADYKVLVGSRVPAVLLELGFLTHRYEAARLGQSGYQQTLARAIAEGICAYLR